MASNQVTGDSYVSGQITNLVEQRTHVGTFPPGNTSPDVSKTRVWNCVNSVPTIITSFVGGQEGNEITVIGDGFTTVQDNAQIITNTQANKLLELKGIYHFQRVGTVWIEPSYNSLPTSLSPLVENKVISGFAIPAVTVSPTLTVVVPGGVAVVAGSICSFDPTTFTVPINTLWQVYARKGTRQLQARTSGYTDLPSSDILFICELYTNATTIYAIYDRRTRVDDYLRGGFDGKEFLKACVVQSGPWQGALKQSTVGAIIWVFGNQGLLPYVEELPTVVEDNLNLQVVNFYSAITGTGSGFTTNFPSDNWLTVHGTTWNSFYNWPYDISPDDPYNFETGGLTIKRPDSHGAYAATFARLALRYFKHGGAAGVSWWNRQIGVLSGNPYYNWNAVYDALYWNCAFRLYPISGSGGGLDTGLQDLNLYTFLTYMDNLEHWRAMYDVGKELVAQGQTTQGNYLLGVATSVDFGLKYLWQAFLPNASGLVDWLTNYFDTSTTSVLINNHQTFYPDMTIYAIGPFYGHRYHVSQDLHRRRLDIAFDRMQTLCPFWWKSRQYDLFPWVILLAGAASAGFRDIFEEGIKFIQSSFARGNGSLVFDFLQVADIGLIHMAERIINGETFNEYPFP